jgi:hypothetical protein
VATKPHSNNNGKRVRVVAFSTVLVFRIFWTDGGSGSQFLHPIARSVTWRARVGFSHKWQDGPLQDYQRALNDLDAAIVVASTLDWYKEPVIGRAWCHREITGTVCALHRWTARNSEDPDSIVVGRLQCWNDPNLIETDPTFVQEHPEFQDVVDAEFEGSVCILELQSHVFGLGCPPGLVFVASDHVIIEENWDVDWEIAIGATDSAVDTLHQMRTLLSELVTSKQQYQEL